VRSGKPKPNPELAIRTNDETDETDTSIGNGNGHGHGTGEPTSLTNIPRESSKWNTGDYMRAFESRDGGEGSQNSNRTSACTSSRISTGSNNRMSGNKYADKKTNAVYVAEEGEDWKGDRAESRGRESIGTESDSDSAYSVEEMAADASTGAGRGCINSNSAHSAHSMSSATDTNKSYTYVEGSYSGSPSRTHSSSSGSSKHHVNKYPNAHHYHTSLTECAQQGGAPQEGIVEEEEEEEEEQEEEQLIRDSIDALDEEELVMYIMATDPAGTARSYGHGTGTGTGDRAAELSSPLLGSASQV